ncbi:hypothetical protein [Halogeometricum limi]|uniref:Uncharacterized protein n=1 Tax=Halogeometricum limi TaxID=555875 RepID=A0A1I6GUM1_9EURY|nr:hypothetical protein [Halogeometricum limi]SFR45955.1 hypothetical protein SAMN04488124_1560 [Halogeometricum limi]
MTFLVGVAYVGSLGVYLAANAGALSSFAAALLANPQAALLGAGGMTAPGTFVLDAVAATPGVALAFPVGVALLTVVFTGVVAKFGHGTAYLYLLGALAPAAAMAVGPVVPPLSTAGTLALVLVLPFLATTLFLADVGRFLASTR